MNLFAEQIDTLRLRYGEIRDTVKTVPMWLRALILGLLLLWPLLAPSPYYVHITVLALLYVVLALGLSVVVHYAGLLDLGYVAFYAVGAYSYALLSTSFDVSFGIGLLVGGSLAAAFGVVLGFPTIRARGDYLALVTLAFGEAIRLILRNWDSVTNGPRGIVGVQPPRIFAFAASQPVHFYYLILAFAVLTVWVVYRVKVSPIGRNFMAIRDDEAAAESVGISAVKWKLYAFGLGAFFAGLMGTFFAGWQRFVSPESFTLLESIIILAMVILGGGSLTGTILAAAFLTLMPEFLRGFLEYRMLAFGLVMIGVVILQEKRSSSRLSRDEEAATPPEAHARYTDDELPVVVLGRIRSQDTPLQPGSVLLRGCNLSKYFDGIQALDGVSLDVHAGEILGLIGPNGAGKTTLFNCISGHEQADTGSLFLGETRLLREGRAAATSFLVTSPAKAHRIAEAGIARTFQHVRLFDSMTVVQNILAGHYCGRGISLLPVLALSPGACPVDRAGIRKADALMAFFGLTNVCDILVANLPLAQQRKVEIARALATEPSLLLLDEPAAGLNESEKVHFRTLIERIRTQLVLTVVLIEHDMNVLMSVSDRVLCMDRGRIIAEGIPEAIRKDAKVLDAYLGTSA